MDDVRYLMNFALEVAFLVNGSVKPVLFNGENMALYIYIDGVKNPFTGLSYYWCEVDTPQEMAVIINDWVKEFGNK